MVILSDVNNIFSDKQNTVHNLNCWNDTLHTN